MTETNFDCDFDPDLNYDFYAENLSNVCNYVSLQEYLSSSNVKQSISIINYNIRCFEKKFPSFSCGFDTDKMPKILCLTETWFSSDSTSDIPCYMAYHVTRDARSGGVSIYVNDLFNSRQLIEFSYATPTIEVCTVEVSVNNCVFIIVGVYRPHSDSIVNFTSHLSNFLDNSFFAGKTCIFLGDLNICLLKDDPVVLDYSNLLYSHHFSNIITKPTHFSAIGP